MLINFKISNFRSFRDKNTFSMEKGKNIRKYKNNVLEVNKVKLLKTAVIFGGNANGKTNLITALRLLRFLVLEQAPSEAHKLPVDTFGYNGKNTKFEISFLKDKKRFDYTVEYNELGFVYEQLEYNNTVVLERHDQDFTVLPEQLLPLKNNIRKNQNLLFFAQSNNFDIAKKAYDWFMEDLIVVNTELIPNNLLKSLYNPVFKAKFLKFLRAADFNITDIEVRERKEAQPNIQIEIRDDAPIIHSNSEPIYTTIYDIYSTHKSQAGEFKIHHTDESAGTKVFIRLALYILQNENAGKVMLIDEFDRSFHIQLAEALLDIFTNEKQKNQFILTTHELSLMDYNLRQDQIWFAEKNEFGETELFSIYDFDDEALRRSDFGYKKRYLEGRFGATQIINKSVLIELVEDSDGA